MYQSLALPARAIVKQAMCRGRSTNGYHSDDEVRNAAAPAFHEHLLLFRV
jgi:hypothetical protein